MKKSDVDKIINWIKNYVNDAKANGVVVGISGGKDSLIVAKLCVDAVGAKNVYGVILPNGNMNDLEDAIKICKILDIQHTTINIKPLYDSVLHNIQPFIKEKKQEISSNTKINIAPRLRMTLLYAFAGELNCLVANTSNLSETMVGYSTKWGDNVGDFSPLANYTKSEVCEIGMLLDLPKYLIYKTPNDGLSGVSDEEKLGFTYEQLDNYIRYGKTNKNINVIMKNHNLALHKIHGVVKYENNLRNYFYGER